MRFLQKMQIIFFFYFYIIDIYKFYMMCGGIPFYGNTVWGCYIRAPPLSTSFLPLVMFSIVPICMVTVVATVNMILVYLHVRQVDNAARRWRFGNSSPTTTCPIARGASRRRAGRGVASGRPTFVAPTGSP